MTKAATISIGLGALLTLAGAAHAQFTNPGDILFTTREGGQIRNISGTAPGASVTLWTSPEADAELAGIDFAPNGKFYVADGRTPIPAPDTMNSGIIEITDLFGAASGSYITRGNPLQRPLGLEYDSVTNRLITPSNPGSPTTPQHIEGIFSISLDGSTVEQLYDEPTNFNPQPPAPRYQAGVNLTRAPGSNDWWVGSINGGVDSDPNIPNPPASTISRLAFNGSSYDLQLPSTIDLSASAAGFGTTYSNLRDLVALPGANGGTDIFFTDTNRDVLARLSLDAADNPLSLTPLVTGLGAQEIEFNPFTNQFVFTASDSISDVVEFYSVNLDGSGLTLLHTTEADQGVAGLYIIPTPGAAGLLAVAGLAAVRRRR